MSTLRAAIKYCALFFISRMVVIPVVVSDVQQSALPFVVLWHVKPLGQGAPPIVHICAAPDTDMNATFLSGQPERSSRFAFSE